MAKKPKTARPSLAEAISRHKAIQAAIASQPEETSDQVFKPLLSEDFSAMEAIARAPCETDAEFLEKLRYLMTFERDLCSEPSMSTEYGSVILAVSNYVMEEQA
jgi:hypothetical protein